MGKHQRAITCHRRPGPDWRLPPYRKKRKSKLPACSKFEFLKLVEQLNESWNSPVKRAVEFAKAFDFYI